MTATTAAPVRPDVPRTALVTGAGRGIGRHLALALAREGYALGLVARTRERLEVVADEARALGAPVTVAVADLVDATEVADAVARVEAGLASQGGIGLLVNNAGVIEHAEAPFAQDDVEDVWRVIETNVRGPLLVTHAVLPGMLARGAGRVLNMNSGSGHRALTTYTGYAVSKGALARFTTQLHAQYAGAGLRVLDLAPGVVATDMTAGMPVHDGRTEWTSPQDVAHLVLGFAAGELDDLSGRFVRAGVDTVASLQERVGAIVATDARTLRLATWGPDDPVA
ncbi:short-chain dehydrogenase/reductase SDR [Cellulomonas flavigena DSM 20109]|uniref:Short-chain dehydrogenase/reductase SDR n=1 Tax=Cellulomonas flavigena (strain ATCC 482 / DSM 20109 / BCRC 11376 / JCM 18109 / NBRC 3775 / NCIMB 8073 / NRS 134) TaxID=446466 RepID=D5UHI4_CELFN|nr:SDR family oxidoreductase [Cellulomonas flavigena]ADG75305.1 short-chain dehydrogenase/reductase SDR [Cellulomonas flavigena DSM 20109]